MYVDQLRSINKIPPSETTIEWPNFAGTMDWKNEIDLYQWFVFMTIYFGDLYDLDCVGAVVVVAPTDLKENSFCMP